MPNQTPSQTGAQIPTQAHRIRKVQVQTLIYINNTDFTVRILYPVSVSVSYLYYCTIIRTY